MMDFEVVQMAKKLKKCQLALGLMLHVLRLEKLWRRMEREERRRKRTRRKRREWVRPWLLARQELQLDDHDSFRSFHRVDREQFQELLQLVEPVISKKDTRMRKAVSAQERLSVTLRYLTTGESRQSLEYSYRISHSLISKIIYEVCEALYEKLQPIHLKLPEREAEWQQIQNEFQHVWQFPNCIGVLDGKRVLIGRPAKSASTRHDYKYHSSVVMLALVDANYKFLYVDVGGVGYASDAGAWDRCSLNKAISENLPKIPPPSALPNSEIVCPSVIVGDDAFPLKTYLMKCFAGQDLDDAKRTFNYRLSEARRPSENAFRILSTKFRLFRQPICSTPAYVPKIILASVVLHNYLCTRNPEEYGPEDQPRPDEQCGSMVQDVRPPQEHGAIRPFRRIARNADQDAKLVREKLMHYFNSEGHVPRQDSVNMMH